MKTISNEQKANEYLYNEVSGYINLTSKNKRDIINAFIKGAEWKDKQLADYLQHEWDRWSGACSTVVSAHCREVERFANDLGIKLKFNNPYIE